MSALVASTRAELLRLRHWPAVWVLVGVWFVLDLLFVYTFDYVSYRTGDASPVADGVPAQALLADLMPDAVPEAVVQGMPMFGGALLMIAGALAVGSGFGWGTWKTVLTQGPGRLAAFGGTLVALALLVLAVVVGTVVLDLGVSNALAAVESQPLGLPALGDLGTSAAAGALVLAMWTSAGVLLGVLARGPALAVGLGLVWALVLENLLRGVSGLIDGMSVLTDHLPGSAAGSLVGSLGVGGGTGADATPGVLTVLDGGTSVVVLAVYLVAFAGAAAVLVRVRDLA